MITFVDSKDKIRETEKRLDSQLWHACAGSMVQMPPVSCKVFYFPQGHAEHACGNVDFRNCPRVPSYIACRVSAIKFMADSETDEVYTKIRLIPLKSDEVVEYEDGGIDGPDAQDKPTSFAKTLTQSDANNGGGFSVPRYCAETMFPRLDYSAAPPVQTLLAKDVHGETWKFRHIYRGTPRRHLLTTGWSTFVNHKKLVAGDSIVFLRAENGDLCIGIRRAKTGIGGGLESSSGWNPAGWNCVVPYGGVSSFFKEDCNKLLRNGNSGNSAGGGSSMGREKVKPESVIEAVTLAANGHPFEVVYYPRASTPEFCVKASLVKAALQIRWCAGIRLRMPFETEDSSPISWFMGTISSVQVADPVRWPDSPWRLLQVTWDEPNLLQNIKHVNPWLVELVSNVPSIHLSPFSPPRKKLRLPQHPDFPLDGQLPIPTFSCNLLGPTSPLSCLPDNAPAGMQGARHAQYGLSLTDLHLNKLHSGLFSGTFPLFDRTAIPIRSSNPNMMHTPHITHKPINSENISCLLNIGNSTDTPKKLDNGKRLQFVLFGQPILTEQQINLSCSEDTISPVGTGNSSSEGNTDKMTYMSDGSGSGYAVPENYSSCEGLQWYKENQQETQSRMETGHCKVFRDSEDVGRTLDLSVLRSYEELYRKLANMFGVEQIEMLNHVLYWDATDSVKQIGDEPFSDFMKTAKRLTILTDLSGDNIGMLSGD
ncbi:auxin response factor 18-like [Actinidia eriantha]|uniref:auxin response factor 18-like n=1 Tax=Actinidia eriantha TaxID=165200 RepID=UPI00258ECE89|nr:auxin response factor 18-like [Actinidia eriantha]